MNKKKKQLQSAIVGIAMFASIAVAPFSGMPETTTVSASDFDNYAKLLQYSMYFYDANMCGTGVDENSQLNWRSDCHTSDEVDFGFHDAGDHVKFGLPQGYSASTLGWGYYEFKDSYDSLGLTSHYKTISDYFCKFFKASTKLSGDTVTSFCYQVGDGDADHDEWCAPEDQTTKRNALWTSSEGSDIAAEYAAALALNYINFGNEEDLKYAKALYKYANQVNKVASTGIGTFYESSTYTDDIAWAAGWLYMATGDMSYKDDCEKNQVQYLGWVHDWNNVSLGAACVYAHITNNWSKVNNWIDSQTTSDNYWFLLKWGSARYNATMQLCALAASKNSTADYSNWCQNQMSYLLGDNNQNQCFVVGYGSNSPKNAHHRGASGYDSYEDMNESTVYDSDGHVLVGALVGGPTDASGSYTDSLQDFTANEVALDYNAGFVGAAAGLYSVYKTGNVDNSIEGVGNVSVDDPSETTEPIVTTAPQITLPPSSGIYTSELNQQVVYSQLPENDKMIGWLWEDFDIREGEKVEKVEIKISSSSNIGKWQGAFGSSTTVSPDYWTQTAEMEQVISGNTGTLTWNVSETDSKILQFGYGGELKFGTWWIDCDTFTIDSITVYTDAASSGQTVTTKAPDVTTTPKVTTVTTTTKAPDVTTTPKVTTVTTTTKAPDVTTKTPVVTTATPSSNGSYTANVNQQIIYSQLPENDKMIGWEWSQFGIPASEKVTKVELNISSSQNIGKWQGAFGSSTTASPDYWTQTSDMQQVISGNSGTITWNVDSATADIIQYGYGGELKFGIWWIDCGTFTIDSIKIYTNGSSTPVVTTTTTPKVTTVTTTTTTPKVTTTSSPKVTDAPAVTTTPVITTEPKATTTYKGETINPSVSAKLKGDVTNDNEVDIRDITALNQYIVKLKTLDAQQLANADVVADGIVDLKDLGQLKKYIIKVIKQF